MTNVPMGLLIFLLALIFFALASIASNITNLAKVLAPGPAERDPDKLVGFGPQYDSFGRTFVNPANVTHLETLTGEGGTQIHFIGGGRLAVGEDLQFVAEQLGQVVKKPAR